MDYDAAISFWYGRINYEVRAAGPNDLKLERMRALLRRLGDPHERVRLVHVTGTKGKGSTCAMLDSILRAAGYRVGLFTSPHLEHVEERMQVNGVPISRAELAALITEVAVEAREMDSEPGLPPPTFFEIGTALGFLHFVRRRCDLAVIEVGLGGRFDSTNVCRPLVSVITNVGLDHTAQLGHTLEEIAFQKAGIIKPRVPVVSGVTQDGPRAVVRRVADEVGAPLWEVCELSWPSPLAGEGGRASRPGEGALSNAVLRSSSEFDRSPLTRLEDSPPSPARGEGKDNSRPFRELRVALPGAHQLQNARVAVAAVERLREAGLPIPESAVARGLAEVKWPARVECVRERPTVILDTAHNVPSAEALVSALRESFPVSGRKRVVFAVSSDKPYPDMLRVLAGYFDHFHLTKYGNNPRCVPPERLAAVLAEVAPGVSFTTHPTSAEAWTAARAATGETDLVCVTGSVFLAGELRASVAG